MVVSVPAPPRRSSGPQPTKDWRDQAGQHFSDIPWHLSMVRQIPKSSHWLIGSAHAAPVKPKFSVSTQ
eukprot:COSAG06_NODE_56069_length_286_cov_1.310160_1_plen_67_part_10